MVSSWKQVLSNGGKNAINIMMTLLRRYQFLMISIHKLSLIIKIIF